MGDPGRFACERGHALDSNELRQAAATRVTLAFWMAIEALETEAEALRALASDGHRDGNVGLAEQAESDAQVLRKLSTAHVPPEYTGDGAGS